MIQNALGESVPRRILLLITTLTYGGAETQVARLAMELKRRSWDVAVACLVAPNAHSGELEENGIHVHSLGMARGIPDPRALLILRSLIKRFKPNIVHSHMYHANLLGRLSRLLCRFPALICTAHNLREVSERGGPTWHKELLYRATDFLADRTTIICAAGFDRYLRVGAVPATKFEIIPNSVDTELYSAAPESRAAARASWNVQGRFVWLTVGRLVKQKDFPTLFRAFKRAAACDSLLLVAGSGPLEAELKAECERLGIAGHVRFCGVREDLINLYRSADAFVLSSELEGLSVALLEAAAVGLPTVATDVGGNAEIVRHGISGYLVPPHNPEQLAAAMQCIEESSPQDRQRLGAAARQRCCTYFETDVIVRRWIDLYQRYLPDSSSHAPVLVRGVAASRARV